MSEITNEILLGLLIIIVVLQVIVSIKEFRRRGFKGLILSFKEFVESIKPSFFMIFGVYILVIGIMALEPIDARVLGLNENLTIPELGWVYLGFGLVWVLFVGYIYYKIIMRIFIPLFKYSDQEKKWQEEDEKNNKIRQWMKLKFPKLFKKEKNI